MSEGVDEPAAAATAATTTAPGAARAPLVAHVAARTDVGCVREANEDAWLVADLGAARRGLIASVERHELGARGGLYAICDGMGGAAAGEVAAALCADVLYAEMLAAPESDADVAVMARLLRRAVRVANLCVHEESKRTRARRGMGTTVSAGFALGGHVVLAQVGDSRAYLWRGGVLTQLTRDQSVVSALVQAGRLTPDEARSFGGANVILQALGVDEDVEVSLSLAELRAGDVLVLCSDGLTGPVGDAELAVTLGGHADLGDAAHALVDAARAAGGPDNITVILVRFEGAGLAPPASAEDLPRFVELDPTEEGERSLSTTSRVARRLAARAGMGDDSPVTPLPPTGQHPSLSEADLVRARAAAGGAGVGARGAGPPALARLRAQSRLSLGAILFWIAVGALVAALVFRAL